MRISPYFVPQTQHYPFLSVSSITEENEITEDKISELQLQNRQDQQTIAKGVEEANALKKRVLELESCVKRCVLSILCYTYAPWEVLEQ